jgi:hypothetical protein
MENNVKNAVKEYQCSGCTSGNYETCFKKNENEGIGCGKHFAGTMILGIGKIFLGMPKGFNRLGKNEEMLPVIFDKFEDNYDKWNIPTWKHLNEQGHTLVRGLRPRKNEPFIHIFLEDCLDKINCFEVSQDDIDKMD